MKKFSLLLLLFAGFNLQAQVNLLGMSTYDGYNGNGFIYKLQNGNLQHVYDFMSLDLNGRHPAFGLVEYNGLYYGVAQFYGDNSVGTIFTYNPTTYEVNLVHSFHRNEGFLPASPLVLYNDKFYGYTSYGSSFGSNLGTFYEFDPVSGNYQTIYETTNEVEGTIYSDFIIENDTLFGIFTYGGAYYAGTLFSLDLNTNVYNVLYDFNPNYDGYPSYTHPVYYNNALYSTLNSTHKIFKYDLSSNVFSIVKDFDIQQVGHYPVGYIVLDNGKIYGTTKSGYNSTPGHIYQYDIDNNDLISLHDITDNLDESLCGLTKHGSLLMGLTTAVTTGGAGDVFSYDLNTATYQYHFALSGGYLTYNFLAYLDNDKVLGLRQSAGITGKGEIFEGDLINNTYQSRYSFNDAPQGGEPYELISAGNGKYYGITNLGGGNGKGVIFEMDDNGNLSVIYHILSWNDPFAMKRLVLADDKLLFYDAHKFFSLDINTHQLNLETDISFYTNSYVKASNGKIYIISQSTADIYEYTLSTGNLTMLAGNPDLYSCKSGILEFNGKLYFFVSTNNQATIPYSGSMISFDLSTQQIEIVKDFDAVTGYVSYADQLTLTELDGKLYGHTRNGGANGFGTLFEYNPANDTFAIILDLMEKNGRGQTLLPVGNHILLGAFGDKIISFDIQAGTQQIMYDLVANDNIYTSYASLVGVGTTAIDKEVLAHFEVYPNPMKDVLHIENKDNVYATTGARIYDISGNEKINTTQLNNIDVSKLSKGIYILQLQLQNGNSVQQLLLKK